MFRRITCLQVYHCCFLLLALAKNTLALCTITDEGESKIETYTDNNDCREIWDSGYKWICQEKLRTVIIGPTTLSCDNSSLQEMYSFYNGKKTKVHFIVKNSFINSLISDGTTWTRLTELTLDHANISTIIPGFFNGFTELTLLNITNNNISEIVDGVFSPLKKLQKLNLSQNAITRLRLHAFLGLSALEMLDLSKNRISFLPENIFIPLNNSLTHLDLSVNNLTLLENTLKLSKIQNVYLKYNNITKIDFSNITKGALKVLDISYNNLTDVKNLDVFQAETVNLSFNNITSLKKIGKIGILNIRGNRLKLLEKNFASEQLTELDLSSNVILNISFEAFAHGTKLKTVNLSENILQTLPTNCFQNLDALENLDLSYNEVLQLEFGTFNSLKHLKYLNISHNKGVVDFHIFLRLKLLENVNFQMNEIKNFDEFFLQTHINLKHITMDGNSWKCSELANIIYLMETKYKISVAKGNSDNSSNIHGIACNGNFKNEATDKIDNKTLKENDTQVILKDFIDDIRNATKLKYIGDVAERFLNLTEKLFYKNETLGFNNSLKEHLIEPKQVTVNTSERNVSMIISLVVCNILLLLLVCGNIIIIIYLKKLKIRIRKDEVELMH